MSATTLLADEYFSALRRASRSDAVEVVARARASGISVWNVAHEVIGRAQHEVGVRWQSNDWTVADEHAASVISQIALSAITGSGTGEEHPLGTIVGACVEGEWHAFPLRLVAEGLREAGWEVIDLGASLPADQLAGFLEGHRPDVVLLSASMPGRLPAAREAVAAAASVGLPAVLGGAAVADHPERAALLGAVAGTAEPSLLGELLVDLQHTVPPTAQRVPRAFDALVEVESQLATRVLSAVSSSGHPGDKDEWESVLGACATELVSSLAASMLVDEPQLLRDQVHWLEEVVAARNGPDGVVESALDVMEQAVDQLAPSASGAMAGVR